MGIYCFERGRHSWMEALFNFDISYTKEHARAVEDFRTIRPYG